MRVLLHHTKSELHGFLQDAFQKVSERENALARQEELNYNNKRGAHTGRSQSSPSEGDRLRGRRCRPYQSQATPCRPLVPAV
jgi:hypothetical protein